MTKWLLLTALIGYTTVTSALNPSREYARRPDLFDIQYEEARIRTDDGYELNTWIMQPTTSVRKTTTVLLVGSDAGNMADLLPYAHQLLTEGYPVVSFDYRGFGDSSEFAVDTNYLYHREFITDFVTVLEGVQTTYAPDRIGVMAFSMGTLIAAAGYARQPFDVFIAEGLVLSPGRCVERLHITYGKTVELPAGSGTDELAAFRVAAPTLLISALADPITTYGDHQLLAADHPAARLISHSGQHLRGAAALGLGHYMESVYARLE